MDSTLVAFAMSMAARIQALQALTVGSLVPASPACMAAGASAAVHGREEEEEEEEQQQQQQQAAAEPPGAVAGADGRHTRKRAGWEAKQRDAGGGCGTQAPAPAAAAAGPPGEARPSGSGSKRAKQAAKEERRRLKRRRRAEREFEAERGGSPPEAAAAAPLPGGRAAVAVAAAPAAVVAPAAAAAAAQAAPAAGAASPPVWAAAAAPAAPAEAAALPAEVYRFWGPADVSELVLLVEDAAHRRRRLGSEALDWGAIAARFGRSVQAVRSKYRHEKVTAVDDGSPGPGGERKRQGGGGPRRQIGYGYMALFGLQSLPGQSGTGEEVCRAVEAHGPFAATLDRSTRADSAGVQRWQQRIREELSHRAYFKRTGQKRGGEAVWVLDSREFDAMPERQRRKLADLRLPAAPQLGRHGTRN